MKYSFLILFLIFIYHEHIDLRKREDDSSQAGWHVSQVLAESLTRFPLILILMA